MKIRRVTLAVLILLTVLFIADVRYFGGNQSSMQGPPIYFSVDRRVKGAKVEKKQAFTKPQGEFTTLLIKGQQGTIILRSTDSEDIVVHSIIEAASQDALDRYEVKESILGSELSYTLSGGSESVQDAGVSFEVEVPAGMEVSIEQNFGEVGVRDFVGFLNVQANLSVVNVWGLEGTATIQNNFGSLDLREIAGPLTINDSFSTSTIGLLAIDGGFDFDVEVINGTWVSNAPLTTDTAQNRLTAKGRTGEGVHPVVIRSSFSTVRVNLEK